MRNLTILVVILGALYSGYWFIGQRTVENAAASAIQQMQADGWRINVSDIETRGFPSRFDTTISDVTLSPPDGSWQYTAPFVQALALSYRPNDVIAALPNEQIIDLPSEQLTVTSERLRASTGVEASTDLNFKGFTAEGDKIALTSSLGWSANLDRILAAMRKSEVGETAYDLYSEATGIEIAGLPPIERLMMDSLATLDKPLNRDTFQSAERGPVRLMQLGLNDATLVWGDMQIRASGDLAAPTGTAEGRITLEVRNWERLLEILVETSLVEAEVADTYRNMGQVFSSGTDRLEVPVDFANGLISIGPLPIGRAPQFY